MYNVHFDQLTRYFKAEPNVIAVWVFGSAQTGNIRPGSDLDLALLFKITPHYEELARIRADLQERLGFDEIDLLVLNDTHSPITRFEAVSGRAVFCRDLGKRAGFVSLTAREYEEAMAFLARGMRAYAEGEALRR